MPPKFETVEIDLRDVAIANTREFFKLGFRKNVPVVLICRLGDLDHSSLIRCSPLNTYFSGIGDYPAFSRGLHDYTSSSLVDSTDFYKGFLNELMKAGIDKTQLPKQLFSYYAHWGAYCKQTKGAFRSKFNGVAFDGRVGSALVPDKAVPAVLRYWNHQLEQFGRLSFYAADEELNEVVGDPLFDFAQSKSWGRFSSPDYAALAGNVFLNPGDEEVALVRLREILHRLRDSEDFVPDLFPLHMVKVTPSISLMSSASYPEKANADRAWERALLRSKIVRRLGYVWQYPTIVSRLSNLRDGNLRAEDDRCSMLDEIEFELEGYLSDMQKRYPVIGENPLSRTDPE